MQKILFIVPGEGSATSMPFVHVLQRNIKSLGIECDTYFSKSTYNVFALSKNIKNIILRLRNNNYDICVAQFGGYSGICAVVASKVAKVPVVVTFRGSDLNFPIYGLPIKQYIQQLLSNLFSQIAAFFADGCVFVSQKLKDRAFFIRQSAVIASGADLNFFTELSMSESRLQLAYPQEAKIALFFSGSNKVIKNTKLAEHLKNYLNKNYSDIDFRIIDRFVTKEELRTLFSAANCLVFLSRSEGCPTLIQEACAVNLPIVSLDVGGVSEVLKGVSHHIIVPNSLEKIASSVAEITSRKVRSNGRSVIKELYCAYDNAKRSISFYQKVIDKFKKKGF